VRFVKLIKTNVLSSIFNLIFAATLVVALNTLPALAGNIDNVGAAAIEQINGLRARKGSAALRISKKLTEAAANHAQDMVQNELFSHTGSNGSSMGDRIRAQNYGFCMASENIAKGQRSLNAVLESWMSSKGHRRNLLNPGVTEFGLVRGSGNLWVMVLGRPGC